MRMKEGVEIVLVAYNILYQIVSFTYMFARFQIGCRSSVRTRSATKASRTAVSMIAYCIDFLAPSSIDGKVLE